MTRHTTKGRFTVSRRHSIDHAFVDSHDLAAHLTRVEPAMVGRGVDRLSNRRKERCEQIIVASFHHREVPGQIELYEARDVVGNQPHLVVELFQLRKIIVCAVECREARRRRFDCFASLDQSFHTHTVASQKKLERAGNLLLTRFKDHRAAIPTDFGLDEALDLKDAKRLSNGGTTQPGFF